MDRRRSFAEADDGQLPMGKTRRRSGRTATSRPASRSRARARRDVRHARTPATRRSRPRTAMAYWQNGKLYSALLDAEHRADGRRRRALGRHSTRRTSSSSASTPAAGSAARSPARSRWSIPALLSKKANAPVMMRITREEEHYIGRARPGVHGRMKVGFAKDGRITALDMFVGQRQRSVRARRATAAISRRHRLAAVSAAGDALARRLGADQHAAARRRRASRAGCRASR